MDSKIYTLFLALGMSFLGNIIAWFHMNAQFRWEWAKGLWWVILGGIPVSILFYYSTRMFYEYYGNYWAVRPVGFGIGTMAFAFLTAIFLNELPSQRIIISLILASVILYINIAPTLK